MNTRFWEFYLVRYLSGTIFGVLVIVYLLAHYDPQISNIFNTASVKKYVISTLLETTDEIKFYKPINSDELRLKQNDMTIVIEENPVGLTTKRVEFNLLAAVTVTVMGFLYMYVSSMLILFLHTIRKCLFYSINSRPSFYMFYKKLSHKRAERERELQVEEYIESYRHLREHGNAFGILLSEIVFAFLLIHTSFNIIFICIWFTIGFFSWIIGTLLEIKLVESKR